jgi:hypothetical protein
MSNIEIDPDIIYHTHSKIRNRFSGCGKLIEDTITEIISGKTKIEDLPIITVEYDGKNYYSLNNRRLYVIKHCKKIGLIKTILVRIKKVNPNKYTNTYSLVGKLVYN